MLMQVAVMFSGGKDSVFAVFWALTQGFDPILVTVIPDDYSMMFHHPNVEFTEFQAKAMGLPHLFLKAKDNEWHKILEKKFKELGVNGIVSGAIASEFQKRNIDSIGHSLGIPTYSPLWHREEAIMSELNHFEIFVTAVSAEGLDKKFLGKHFSLITKANIPNIHPLLEGGEGETFVTNGPIFNYKLDILEWVIDFDGIRGIAKIKKLS